MSEVWAKGDLAECICADWMNTGITPQVGDILRVDTVMSAPFWGQRIPMIGFETIPLYCWQATAFRKIKPTIAPASKLWIAWLRRQLSANRTESAA
jgi:hypothetical protein